MWPRPPAPFEAALAKSDKDAAALAGLGALLFDEGLPDEAEPLLAKARRLDQARPFEERKRTRVMLAQIALLEGRAGDVRKLREEAAALRPEDDDGAAGKSSATPPRSR